MTLTCWTIMLPKKSTGIISLFFSSSYTMPHLTVERGEKRPFLFLIFQLISRWFSFLTLSSSQKIWDRHSQRERRKRVHQTAIAWLLCIFHARHFFFFSFRFEMYLVNRVLHRTCSSPPATFFLSWKKFHIPFSQKNSLNMLTCYVQVLRMTGLDTTLPILHIPRRFIGA